MAKQPPPAIKPVVWLGSTKKDLLALPASVIDPFGYALYIAQTGKKHEQAKPLHGFGSAGVLEIVDDWRGNIYTVPRRGGCRVARIPQAGQERNGHTEAGHGVDQAAALCCRAVCEGVVK